MEKRKSRIRQRLIKTASARRVYVIPHAKRARKFWEYSMQAGMTSLRTISYFPFR